MDKYKILSMSKKEFNDEDLVENEIKYQAERISVIVATCICILISILSKLMTGKYIVSLWIVYFSIIGTQWLVRFIKLKKKSDLMISLIFIVISIILFIVQIMQFLGVLYE